jgi:hypothetical protein
MDRTANVDPAHCRLPPLPVRIGFQVAQARGDSAFAGGLILPGREGIWNPARIESPFGVYWE